MWCVKIILIKTVEVWCLNTKSQQLLIKIILTHQILYTSNLLYYVITAWHVPDAVYTVLELLMMGGETARNM
jgi:hypothetical protein